MNKDDFRIDKDSLRIGFTPGPNTKRLPWEEEHKYPHYRLFGEVFSLLKRNGFIVPKEHYKELTWSSPEYKILWKNHKCCGNKYLRVSMNRYPNGFAVEFYYRDSRTGHCAGYYDFQKWDHASILERMTFLKMSRKIAALLKERGAEEDTRHNEYEGRRRVMWEINENPGRHWGKWEDYKNEGHFGYNNKDRDGKILNNGEIKYFRDWSGRLSRGQVYHNINNMWWVVTSEDSYTNKAGFELYDAKPEDFLIRRLKAHKVPKDGLIRMRIGTKVFNEMRAKGVKMELEAAK